LGGYPLHCTALLVAALCLRGGCTLWWNPTEAGAGMAVGGAGAGGGKAKRLPNFKLLHEREQARVSRFKVRTARA
jgi:hypothetical protein